MFQTVLPRLTDDPCWVTLALLSLLNLAGPLPPSALALAYFKADVRALTAAAAGQTEPAV